MSNQTFPIETKSSPEEKPVTLLLSTMRSGSTLLKALLSFPEDASNLPETNFQKYQSKNAAREVAALAPEKVIILKRPAWFNEGKSYPKLPNIPHAKKVILVRDVHPNLLSLRKMAFRKLEPFVPSFVDDWMAVYYWAKVYNTLADRFPANDPSNFWIRYEDLVKNPIKNTKSLFEFIGSAHGEGIDSYGKPDSYEWKWGTDDGGHKIKSLKVQASPIPQKAMDILARVGDIEEVKSARKRFGYTD